MWATSRAGIPAQTKKGENRGKRKVSRCLNIERPHFSVIFSYLSIGRVWGSFLIPQRPKNIYIYMLKATQEQIRLEEVEAVFHKERPAEML